MNVTKPYIEPLMSPGEVAQLFRVDPKTVSRWARMGRIKFCRTPGGHRRFRESDVYDLLAEKQHGAEAQRAARS